MFDIEQGIIAPTNVRNAEQIVTRKVLIFIDFEDKFEQTAILLITRSNFEMTLKNNQVG